jgi:hypothetical protein
METHAILVAVNLAEDSRMLELRKRFKRAARRPERLVSGHGKFFHAFNFNSMK